MKPQGLNLVAVFTRQAHLTTNRHPWELSDAGRTETVNADVQISASHRHIAGDRYEVTLSAKLVATGGGDTLYTGDFAQCLVADITSFAEHERANILAYFLPNQLVPYLRELISSSTQRTGYAPFVVPALLFQPQPVAETQTALPGAPRLLN